MRDYEADKKDQELLDQAYQKSKELQCEYGTSQKCHFFTKENQTIDLGDGTTVTLHVNEEFEEK